MDTTVKRFESGVHEEQQCGLNKSGYAAIDSAYNYCDVHNLSSSTIQSSSRPLLHCRKRSFSSSEGLVYIFMKLVRVMSSACTYILLLSREMPVSSTMKSIIEASASKSNVIVVVVELNGVFQIDVHFMNIHISHTVDSFRSLKSFLVESGLTNKIVVIGYPSMPDSSMDISNSLETILWCVPASRHLTYSSIGHIASVEHFVYPWSKSPLCSGFTLGKGTIGYSSIYERNRYVGLYNTYETMISSVPYGVSCTDCTALQSIASDIKLLTSSASKHSKPKHLKRSSIDALEELRAKILEYTI